jgi:hypothetical protein
MPGLRAALLTFIVPLTSTSRYRFGILWREYYIKIVIASGLAVFPSRFQVSITVLKFLHFAYNKSKDPIRSG